MKTNKLLVFGASLAVSLFCLVIFKAPSAFAATRTWDGGGGDDNFNTAANWSGDAVPTTGDDIVFSMTGMSGDETLNNNISNLSVASITFSGSSSQNYRYTLTGNAITVTSTITDAAANVLDLDITLGADVTATMQGAQLGTTFGSFDNTRTLDTNGHTLTIEGSGVSCGMSMYSKLGGSGGVTVNLPAGGVKFRTNATSFTGPIAVTAGAISIDSTGAFGSTSGVTVSGASRIGLATNQADAVYTFPITLGGSGVNGASILVSKGSTTIGCAGGGSNSTIYSVTLSGGVTLTTDVVYDSYGVSTVITEPFTTNGHTLSVKSGADGTLTTPEGTTEAPVEVFTINAGDDQPGISLSIQNNQTYIVNGVRGSASVGFGGVLKGSGVLNGGIFVNGGGRLAPGQSPGCLTSNNNVTMAGNSNFDVELGGTTACSGYDQLVVNGEVYLSDTGAILNIWLYNDFKPAAGQTFTIINNDGSDAINDTFKDLPEGAMFNSDGYVYQISYVGGDGNDVVLTVVSVPGAPDTGLAYFQNRPLVTLAVTSLAAGAVIVLARKYNKRMNAVK